MIAPRWRKVMRDLWSQKAHTILVVLSIAVGVHAARSATEVSVRAALAYE